MIKAGIFDLDGTLAYTLDSMAYICLLYTSDAADE